MRRKNPEEGHTVGLALHFLRRDAGLTLRQLSAATGSTPSSLSRYEKGRQMPRLDTLRRVVAGLGLTHARPATRPADRDAPTGRDRE